jgi:hypothetical protein
MLHSLREQSVVHFGEGRLTAGMDECEQRPAWCECIVKRLRPFAAVKKQRRRLSGMDQSFGLRRDGPTG